MTRDLTKWPRLLVTGSSVTREQANEILVRTNVWWMSTNDGEWERAVCGLVGIPQDTHGRVDWEALDAFNETLGVLDLSYLNNSRVASSWIGGPHGWCDWDGNIGCSTWNIGKWPTVEEVHDDWTAIAAAFPYLRLRAQLVPDEGEAEHPAVEWLVRDGKAHLVESVGLLCQPEELSETALLARLAGVRSERGVTLDRLRVAVGQVRRSLEEDAEDIADARRAMEDPAPSIPHSEVLARYAAELAEAEEERS